MPMEMFMLVMPWTRLHFNFALQKYEPIFNGSSKMIGIKKKVNNLLNFYWKTRMSIKIKYSFIETSKNKYNFN